MKCQVCGKEISYRFDTLSYGGIFCDKFCERAQIRYDYDRRKEHEEWEREIVNERLKIMEDKRLKSGKFKG
jgi:hypothetical protein